MTNSQEIQEAGIENDLVARLFRQNPSFHGSLTPGARNYAISEEVCQWLFRNIPSGAATLETGCGYSTVVFASRSARHTVISPFPGEHTLIQQWCKENGVSTEHVEFIASGSQQVLPQRPRSPLDLVLIDGDHSFPAPMIDWYYVADDVKLDGIVLVDDTHIVSGRILRDFLKAEAGRWSLEREMGKTAVFRRTSSSPVVEGIWWGMQPYNKDLLSEPPTRLGRFVVRVGRRVLPYLPHDWQRRIRRLRKH